MILAIDVYYQATQAKTVAVAFENWKAEQAHETYVSYLDSVAEYIPGQFYQRELPCILAVLKQVNLSQVDLIIVDGYVTLDGQGKKGLGAHLFEALEQHIPIIGVAKRHFHGDQRQVAQVLRGESKTPLYVTSAGIPLRVAAEHIQEMAGPYRMPTLLTILDQLTKSDSH